MGNRKNALNVSTMESLFALRGFELEYGGGGGLHFVHVRRANATREEKMRFSYNWPSYGSSKKNALRNAFDYHFKDIEYPK